MSGKAVLRRVIIVGASALVAVATLLVFFAWLALHVQWEIPDPAALSGPTTIRARDGTVLTRFTSEVDRRVVPLDRVSRHAVNAVVASEDERFRQHGGVDPLALLRAVARNIRTGAIEQGGSTLTQQYVKNAFTGDDRTFMRKVREAVISIQLERELSKDEILERYVNTVYFGEGAYGIEAAARTYFGVSAEKLDAVSSATLAQLLPAPSIWNPRADPEGARERRDGVLRTMGRLGMLSASEVEEAVDSPVSVRKRTREETPYSHFVAHVRRTLQAEYGEEAVLTGALDVRTSLDPRAQQELEKAVEETLPRQEDDPTLDAAAVAIHPATGEVLAMYGGRDFRESQVNLAVQGRYLVGSTFKPVVFAAALDQGVEPDRTYSAPAQITIADWSPKNYDGVGHGSLTLREALVDSVNTVYAQLGRDVGAAAITRLARRMGVTSRLSADPDRPPPLTIALGAPDVIPNKRIGPTVLDVGAVYATFANDGLNCPPRSVLEVRGRDGRRLAPPRPHRPASSVLENRPGALKRRDADGCYGALDANIARTTTEVLEDVVARGTGTRARIDRPQAGKTGTTNDSTDAWFAGYTPDLALTVWIGHRDGSRPLENVLAAGRTWSSVSGGTIPAIIWKIAAEAILADVAPTDFPDPGEIIRKGRWVGPAMGRNGPATADDEETTAPTAGPRASPSPAETRSPSESPQPTFSESTSPSEGASSEPDDDGDDDGDDDEPCVPVVSDDC